MMVGKVWRLVFETTFTQCFVVCFCIVCIFLGISLKDMQGVFLLNWPWWWTKNWLTLAAAVVHEALCAWCYCLNTHFGIDKLMEWSMIPACPSLMCFFFFFIRGNIEGINSPQIVCLIFVFVFCKFVCGLMSWFLDSLWFDDHWLVCRVNRRQIDPCS